MCLSAPYMHFSSKKSEAIAFLGEVKKQFKEGNLPLYKAAIDNLEKFYELRKNENEQVCQFPVNHMSIV